MSEANDEIQLSLNLKDDEFAQVPVEDAHIGAQLLESLTQGQYRDPLHCVREYIQNGVDARAKTIIVKITGNSVLIRDDGTGMSIEELIEARGLGVSNKDEDQVGFRGIGLYSAYGICDRLVVTTKQSRERKSYLLTIDFAGMRRLRRQEKVAKVRRKTSLKELIYRFTRLSQTQENDDSHYTLIQLETISAEHIARLSDRSEMRTYILRNISVDFDESFAHRKVVNEFLRENVKGYQPVKIRIEYDGLKPEVIVRPAIPNLRTPDKGTIKSGGRTIACYWGCMHLGEPSNLPNSPSSDDAKTEDNVETDDVSYKPCKIPDEYKDHAGFVYKVKNFTIGTNRDLQDRFKRYANGGLYWWWSGEIYVLDSDIRPNTSRDNFEVNHAFNTMNEKVSGLLRDFETNVMTYRETRLAEREIEEAERKIKELTPHVNVHIKIQEKAGLPPETEANSVVSDLIDSEKVMSTYDIYSTLQTVIKDLKDHGPKYHDRPKVTDLVKQAEALRSVVSQTQTSVSGTTPATRKTRTTRKTTRAIPQTSSEPAPVTERERNLLVMLSESGWEVSEPSLTLLTIIDTSLRRVLGEKSKAYEDIVSDIDQKLKWQDAKK